MRTKGAKNAPLKPPPTPLLLFLKIYISISILGGFKGATLRMLSSSMSTNVQLERWAHKLGIPLRGIVMKTQLEQIDPHPGGYILNLADEDKPGTHWCGIWITSGAQPFYFDSFGLAPPIEVIDFIRPISKKLHYETKQIQNIQSGFCGSYCLDFLTYMNRKPRNLTYLQHFKNYERRWK